MNPQTTLFLVHLSHEWSSMVLGATVGCGIAAYGSGVLLTRTRISKRKRIRRLGMAVRMICLSLLAVSLVTCVISFLHIGCSELLAQSHQCISNLKQVSIGALMYAQDYDERLPPAIHWSEAIDSRVKKVAEEQTHPGDPFHCPAADSPASYGMNAALSAISLSEIDAPAEIALFFDADAPIRSFAGGVNEVARERHNHTPVIALGDGHVRQVNDYAWKQLQWTLSSESGKPKTAP